MTIVITLPYFFDGEAEQIVQLLHSSVDLIHIRKPESKAEEVEKLYVLLDVVEKNIEKLLTNG